MKLTVGLIVCLSPTGVCSFFARSCRGGTCFSIRLMPAGHLLFTYGLPVASSRCLAKVRKRTLASVRRSVPPGASAIRATDAAGESSASWLSTAERREGRQSQPRWLSAAASVARPRKKAKKSPGMRLPVPDSCRNGKSHIPGPAASARTSTHSKKPGVLFKPALLPCSPLVRPEPP